MRAGVAMVALLAGCRPEVVGSVRSEAGPIAGAVLRAQGEPPCEAVTGPDGAFHARCPAGDRTFEVTHPDHRGRELRLELPSMGTLRVPPVELARVPTEAGLYLDLGQRFEALTLAPFYRAGSDAEGWRWCVHGDEAEPHAAPPGVVTVLDQLGADWRLFRLDPDGCAYRLTPTASGYWSWAATPLEVTRAAGPAAGRDLARVELSAGDYVLAEWFAGALVPEAQGDRWRAWWIRVEAPGP